jgi:DNA-directed RNA polymerase subunit RPC12/RpoP
MGEEISMMPIDEKLDAFHRAVKLLDQHQDETLRYAALEVRRCLEAVVYEKLWAYKNRLPTEMIREWRPPQAFKALIAIESGARHTSIISVAKQKAFGMATEEPYKQLGIDLRPDVKWLEKTWHKLGKFPHAEFPYDPAEAFAEPDKVRTMLLELVEKIRPFVKTTFTSTVAEIISFECTACGDIVLANKKSIETTGYITCLNPRCELRYLVKEKHGEDFEFELENYSADCSECGEQILLPKHKLSTGYEFSCLSCHCHYQVDHEWTYRKITESNRSDWRAKLRLLLFNIRQHFTL